LQHTIKTKEVTTTVFIIPYLYWLVLKAHILMNRSDINSLLHNTAFPVGAWAPEHPWNQRLWQPQSITCVCAFNSTQQEPTPFLFQQLWFPTTTKFTYCSFYYHYAPNNYLN